MKRILRSAFAFLLFATTLLFANKVQAKVDQENIQKASKHFVLQHAKAIFTDKGQKLDLAWHYSHASHESHYSHASHQSHYSHYSSW